ncbi:HD domain-containing protein [Intestinibaculum porci]|uniref:HD domain-containing protein n=1 Tax=Intestinibaculum porci TaxID=2487118 RepID=UPI002409BECD|nr:HD domain-containing protein [Intestinibaculum porci]MDD6349370.1 HD domain-containing protein [Intestinibaculum porci]MDD6423408.1 HD domain-containing protein [Intestinibaculum porci]
MNRLEKQMAFALKIDEEKNILRQTHLSHHGRRENDAEHAWHMSIMAYLLKEYANEEIDLAHTMMMCLIHDIVEIEAGDTYAYDEEGKKTQAAREALAADHLFGLLPEDQKQEMIALFNEFEESKTPEAKFAHAMDNLQPFMLNDANDGGDWREHGVTKTQVYGRQSRTAEGSLALYEYTDKILQKHIAKGDIKDE